MKRSKYSNKKSLTKQINILFVIVLLVAMFPMTTFAKSISELQTVVGEESIELFLPKMSGEITEAKAQIGNIANAEVTITPIADGIVQMLGQKGQIVYEQSFEEQTIELNVKKTTFEELEKMFSAYVNK